MINLNFQRVWLLVFLVASVLITGCDEVNDDDPIIERVNLFPISETLLDINDIELHVDSTARISMGIIEVPENYYGQINLLSLAGFWITQDAPDEKHANLVWYYYPESNYSTEWQDSTHGVFRIEPNLLNPDTINWPVLEGFPVDGDGDPKLIGDLMLWSSLSSDTVENAEAFYMSPIPDASFTQTVWAFEEVEYSRTMFMRKTVQNNSPYPMENIRISFWADMDLDGSSNSTGYDSSRALSYTYSPSDTGHTYVAGLTFLEVNGETNITDLVSSHRIMRKNNYVDPDFGEHVESVDQFVYASKGLSNSGQPMINPITSEVSNYAFTGNPLNGTGWLDVQIDVRSLINSPEFSILANDYASVTVVITIVEGENLTEALSLLKQKVDTIRGESDKWLFDS